MELPGGVEVQSRFKVLAMHTKCVQSPLKVYTNRLFMGVSEW